MARIALCVTEFLTHILHGVPLIFSRDNISSKVPGTGHSRKSHNHFYILNLFRFVILMFWSCTCLLSECFRLWHSIRPREMRIVAIQQFDVALCHSTKSSVLKLTRVISRFFEEFGDFPLEKNHFRNLCSVT